MSAPFMVALEDVRVTLAGRTDAQVLVLDEPTAHLDSPTAQRLVEDVFAGAGDRCVLPITHRPEGLDLADELVVLPDRYAAGEGRPPHLERGTR